MVSKTLKNYIRVSLAGFMSVWLTGVVFLLCCERMNAAMSEADSCPLAKMSAHCDKIEKANTAPVLVAGIPSDQVDCCGFLTAVFDKNRKLERDQKQTAPTSQLVAVQFDPPKTLDHTPRLAAVYSHVSYQKDLSIKNCVFRI
ncbi:MAG: hypothetical protein WKF34_07560 [Pyrinomonadaceae bacterium]